MQVIHLSQDLITILLRHHKVQKHGSNVSVVLLKKHHCLFPVFRLQQIIIPFKYTLQYDTVYLNIINNQDGIPAPVLPVFYMVWINLFQHASFPFFQPSMVFQDSRRVYVLLPIPYHFIPENAIILPLPHIKPHRKALRGAAFHAAGRRALKSLRKSLTSCCISCRIRFQCCYYGMKPAKLRPNSLHFESASSSGVSWAITPCPPTTAAPAPATRSSQPRIHCPSPQP